MSRIAIPTREDAPAAAQPMLDAVGKQLGVVPNLFRLVALSPAALQGFRGDAQIIEIVVVVAENVLTNFVNLVADTDIDFPVVRADEKV